MVSSAIPTCRDHETPICLYVPPSAENIFYNSDYLEIQEHRSLRKFQNEHFRVYFEIKDEVAMSLPRGLFGSFESKEGVTENGFSLFTDKVISELKQTGVTCIEIIHPPEFYSGFVPLDWMRRVGFVEMYADINHHIGLENFRMHPMESRKLEKLSKSGMITRELSNVHLKEVYEFLAKCRSERELELNISFQKLDKLFKAFPERYSIFGSYLNGQLASAVITVQVTDEVVYYYLPGTLDKYKKESPMVGLIDYLVDHFKPKSKFLDLGISSIQGKPQEGLIAFKEKMGGVRSEKIVFSLNLNQSPFH